MNFHQIWWKSLLHSFWCTVHPKKYAHGLVVLCFVVVMQSFIMNSHEVFIHIHQGCFAGTGAIVRLPQCQWSKPDGYGQISQCITTTKHSKAKTVCIFLGIYCKPRQWNIQHLAISNIKQIKTTTSNRTQYRMKYVNDFFKYSYFIIDFFRTANVFKPLRHISRDGSIISLTYCV